MADGPPLVHAIVVFAYLLALLAVGAWKARRVEDQEDFSLAGRNLSTFVLAGTLLATWIGTGSIFGVAEKTYRSGAAGFLLPVSSVAGFALLAFLAARIRRFGQFTIQDILEARFGLGARLVGTLTLLAAYVVIVSYQYRAGAAVVGTFLPELGRTGAIATFAGFVVAYTALAGMVSVAYTDVVNGILMTVGLLVALPILLASAGGAAGIRSALPPERLDVLGTFGGLELASLWLPSFLLVLGDANLYQRFFAARDPRAARNATIAIVLGIALLDGAIVAISVIGSALVEGGSIDAPLQDGHLMVHLATVALPAPLGALLLATIVAVIVSTADSFLLAPATSVVRDVYQRFLRPGASERSNVLVGRAVVVVLGAVALGLAYLSNEFFSVALFAYTLYGASITPAMLAAFFWRRATGAGAFASMSTGFATAIAWKLLVEEGRLATFAGERGWSALADACARASELGIDAVLPAIALSLVVLVAVSLATPPPPPERAAIF